MGLLDMFNFRVWLIRTGHNSSSITRIVPTKAFIFIASAFLITFICTAAYFNNGSLYESHRIQEIEYEISSSYLDERDIPLNTNTEISVSYLKSSNENAETTLLNKNGDKEKDTDCFCSGENFCFQGLNENGTQVNGKKFDCSFYDGLKSNNLLDSDAENTENDYDKLDDSWQPIFVTAVSQNHFRESRKLIKSIKEHYAKSKIVVFDLGLTYRYKSEVKSWCNVEYREFEFNKYPSHLNHLKNYAFKLAIIEAFQKYKTFFYFDSSVRVEHNNLHKFLDGVKSGIVLPFSTFTYADHSVFATTKKGMFEYLPLPEIISHMEEIQSTFMFLSDSPYTRYIFKWWYLCAMTPNCIAPEGSKVSCDVNKYYDRRRTFMDCHRFDQAYWNIANLVYLFGNKQGALKLGYIEEDWTQLTENLIAEVEQKRRKALDPFYKLVKIDRNSELKGRLWAICPKQ